ncbi:MULTISPECIES: hypothetical protein [Bacillaceae]|uniref:hypothetical protein n=1 Tax=Bacillaceae TaxID=186817 RepID=UPI00296519EC|nr:hypothetical protein [Bacillus infantis]MDW2879575.1 hypothetical protein [Bacillus infantis]
MNHPFKEAVHFYVTNIGALLLFAVSILLPLLVFHALIMNYVYAVTPVINNTTPGADLLYGFLTLVLLTIAQIPFIKYVYDEEEGQDNPIRNAYKTLALLGFSIFVFALLYGILTIAGTLLFIIPGILIMIFLFLVPYLSVLEGKPVRKVWKASFKMGKKHFLALLFIVGGIGLLEMVITFFSQTLVFSITSSYAAHLFSQMLLNMIIFPFMVILVTFYVMKWRAVEQV